MTSPSPALSRRALARGAAWSVPALTLSAAAPVLAASPTGCPVTWYAESRTNLSLPDYSNNGYTAIYVNHAAAVQPGYLKVMHWASPDNTTLFWRPALGVGTEHTDSVSSPAGAYTGSSIFRVMWLGGHAAVRAAL